MKKIATLFLVTLGLFILATPAFAQFNPPSEGTGPYLGLEYGKATGLGESDIRFTTANIISVALGLLGTICVILMLYAGFKWMMAGGNEENVKEATNIIKYAVIGLIIILSAYAITKFVMANLFKATTGYDYKTTMDNY